MLNITLNNSRKITVPTSWNELNAERFIKLQNVINLFRNDDGDVVLDGEALFQKICTTIIDVSRDELMEMDYNAVMGIKIALTFLNEPMPEPKNVTHIKYNNYIIKVNNFDTLTFGQYADIQQLLLNNENDATKMLAKIIDVYEPKNILKLRFKNKNLNLSTEQKVKIINDLSCVDYNNISFFLLKKMAKSMRTLTLSLNKQAVVMDATLAYRSILVITRLSYLWLITKLTKSKKPQTSL